jgi:hypothetical protein
MKTVFINSADATVITEINESMNLRCGQKILIGDTLRLTISDSIVNLDLNQIEVYVWQNPFSDK